MPLDLRGLPVKRAVRLRPLSPPRPVWKFDQTQWLVFYAGILIFMLMAISMDWGIRIAGGYRPVPIREMAERYR